MPAGDAEAFAADVEIARRETNHPPAKPRWESWSIHPSFSDLLRVLCASAVKQSVALPAAIRHPLTRPP